MEFEFTANWLNIYKLSWTRILEHFKPRKVLEIGAYEGRTTCFFIESLSGTPNLEIHCVDSWTGGEEHANVNMADVERRFRQNINIALGAPGAAAAKVVMSKGESFDVLNGLYAQGHRNTFDLTYVDGSHQACDVLGDLVHAYRLSKVGALIVCDDYLWQHPKGLLHEPKIAIDAFSAIFRERLAPVIDLPLRQIAFRKIA